MQRSTDSTTACKRWKLLKKFLFEEKQTTETEQVSVRRFTSFNLVRTKLLYEDNEQKLQWYAYTVTECNLHLDICHPLLEKSDIFSFNNTGNVCVWPSEEVLTHYCLKHLDRIRGLSVCELGGGMTCLAGLCLASKLASEKTDILLTDGNEKSIANVRTILNKNQVRGTECRVLRWDQDYPDLRGRFDLIISADCLFFDEFRASLVTTIDRLLTERGEAWITAPMRSQTLTKFLYLAGESFTVQVYHQYDPAVTGVHRDMMCRGKDVYDPDLHHPLLIKLHRKHFTN